MNYPREIAKLIKKIWKFRESNCISTSITISFGQSSEESSQTIGASWIFQLRFIPSFFLGDFGFMGIINEGMPIKNGKHSEIFFRQIVI